MSRKRRIDIPGAPYHVIGRGIAPKRIFLGDADRDDFLDRLGAVLGETKTTCYAWALIPSHFTCCSGPAAQICPLSVISFIKDKMLRKDIVALQ